VSIGGNISSSPTNVAYVGIEARHWENALTRITGKVYFGRLYASEEIGLRRDYAFRTPLFVELYQSSSRFDYFGGSQDLFFEDVRPSYLKIYDTHGRINLGLGMSKNSILKIGLVVGGERAHYYSTNTFGSKDIPDKMYFNYTALNLTAEKNTLNYIQFPTSGHKYKISGQFVTGKERNVAGSDMPSREELSAYNTWFSIKASNTYFMNLGKIISLGFTTEGVISTNVSFIDYYSNLSLAHAFEPSPHSRTMFLDAYRANTYFAMGLSPVFKLTETFYLETGAYVFQPYKQIERGTGNTFIMSEIMPRPSFIGEAAIVWQTPVGPLSLAMNYYSKHINNFYFVFNFGYIIFNKKGLNN
jgi:NTE family protein